MAEVLLRDRLERAGIAASVSSAGRLYEGEEASESGVEAMAERGLDLSGHRSRVLTPALLAGVDLVLGMAREHVRDAVALDRAALARTFTLKELVRRGELVGARQADETLAGWLEVVAEGRAARDLLGTSVLDDVDDPIGRPFRFYQQTAEELEDLLDRLVDLVWPPPPPPAVG